MRDGLLRLVPMTDTPRREPSKPGDAAEERALRESYRAETASVLRQRLDLAVILFAVFMGLGTVLEMRGHPERAAMARLFYGTEVLTGIVAVALCRLPRLQRAPGVLGGIAVGALAAQIIGYHALVGAHAERVAMVLLCVLNLVAVLLPWGVTAQILAALLPVASFAAPPGRPRRPRSPRRSCGWARRSARTSIARTSSNGSTGLRSRRSAATGAARFSSTSAAASTGSPPTSAPGPRCAPSWRSSSSPRRACRCSSGSSPARSSRFPTPRRARSCRRRSCGAPKPPRRSTHPSPAARRSSACW